MVPGLVKKEDLNVKFCKTKRNLISISIIGVMLWNQLQEWNTY